LPLSNEKKKNNHIRGNHEGFVLLLHPPTFCFVLTKESFFYLDLNSKSFILCFTSAVFVVLLLLLFFGHHY
jgi:hypothetical protein